MPTAEQDTEITLGTGRMLALFFALCAVCAVFFAIGFSLGRKSASVGTPMGTTPGTPAAVVRPSVAKNSAAQTPTTDFGFYKAVEQKTPDGQPPTKEPAAQPVSAPSQSTNSPAPDSAAPAPANAYYVQVAAVSRQEDADALVEALKRKQYPAFIANPAGDKLYHVQVGPFTDVKDAELTRGKLVGDGYTPILKR